MALSESIVEEAALDWLRELGYLVIPGSDALPGEGALRKSDSDVILSSVLRGAIRRLNPELSEEDVEAVFEQVTHPVGSTLEEQNRAFHRLMINGAVLENHAEDGSREVLRKVLDHERPELNDWIVINQMVVVRNGRSFRPDLVLFVNGLPLAMIELKNPAGEGGSFESAALQVQEYKAELPTLFMFNELLVVSDGVEARVGTLTDRYEALRPWRTITGYSSAPVIFPKLQIAVEGLFERRRFLDLIRSFLLFESVSGERLIKRMATYYQLQAANIALAETLRASGRVHDSSEPESAGRVGDRRIGVVGQAQGSGKSLTMAFYAARLLQEPAMNHPAVVVVTDRLELSHQIFWVFSRFQDLLWQRTVRAEDRRQLRDLLSGNGGGVIVTTIHKFLPTRGAEEPPVLSLRWNLVVVVDEVHRSQLGSMARHMREALPNASFIGFTEIMSARSEWISRAVFGETIYRYDLREAIADGMTLPVYLERRTDFARAEDSEEHLTFLARDIVEHFERRLEAMDGKALIVCRSRRACVVLYQKIVALRPAWHNENDGAGGIKVLVTGSVGDPVEWQSHARHQSALARLTHRFTDPEDPLRLAIVCNLWLTGLDVPTLHTIYLDRPLREHELLQAISRVSRPFGDKPGGLVVVYREQVPELEDLRGALLSQEDAIAAMLKAYDVCLELFQGFDWSAWASGGAERRRELLPDAQEHILVQADGERHLRRAVERLSQSFALALPSKESLRIEEDVAFFQAVRLCLAKLAPEEVWKKNQPSVFHAIGTRRFASEARLDVFSAAGLSISGSVPSIFSGELVSAIRQMPQINLAVRLLSKLLSEEIRLRSRKNLMEARAFAQRVEEDVMRRYCSGSAGASETLDELITLARRMRESQARGEVLGLDEEEIAFYDALDVDDPSVQVLGAETLRNLARSLHFSIRRNVTVDWMLKESHQTKLRQVIDRILKEQGYPPHKQERTTEILLKQAHLFSDRWLTGGGSGTLPTPSTS